MLLSILQDMLVFVIHLRESRNLHVNNNINGTQNVINVCEKYGIEKVLYASTSSVMANNDDITME